MKPRVLDIFDEIIGECVNSRSPGGNESEDDRWRVYLTGHSMGGALATLCAYELAVSHHLVSMQAIRLAIGSICVCIQSTNLGISGSGGKRGIRSGCMWLQ